MNYDFLSIGPGVQETAGAASALFVIPDNASGVRAKLVAIDNQLDDAQKALKDATEMTDIAQARERFKAAAWRAEHEMPQLFSTQRMLVTTNLPVQLDAMPQLELARRVAWILTSGAAAARAQAQAQLALPAPGPEPETDLPTE